MNGKPTVSKVTETSLLMFLCDYKKWYTGTPVLHFCGYLVKFM